MASSFKLKTLDGSAAAAGSSKSVYAVPASTVAVAIGMVVANTTMAPITFDVQIIRANGGDTVFLVKDIPVPAGSALDLIAGSKIVLEDGDDVRLICDTANAYSASLSIMEMV